MFAIGHMGIAYLLGKTSAGILRVKFNLPLILVLSVLPDIDILFDFILKTDIHRGPTHSIISAILVFVPFFILYKQKAVPYFIALISHSLIADFLIGGQLLLLWPLSTREFGFFNIKIDSLANVVLEFTLFVITLIAMVKTRDLLQFLRNSKLNLFLAIPVFTVLLPTFLSYPLNVPFLLIFPHIFYLVLFVVSVFIALKGIVK